MSDVQIEVDSREIDNLLYRGLFPRMSGTSLRGWLSRRAWAFLRLRMLARFQTEGDDASGKWAELMINTRRIRATKGYPAAHPINKRTGELERFVTTSRSIADGGGNPILSIPGRGGSALTKAKLLTAQTGANASAARPVLALGEIDARALTSDLQSWIMSGGVWS